MPGIFDDHGDNEKVEGVAAFHIKVQTQICNMLMNSFSISLIKILTPECSAASFVYSRHGLMA